jgi:hypothetical protein
MKLRNTLLTAAVITIGVSVSGCATTGITSNSPAPLIKHQPAPAPVVENENECDHIHDVDGKQFCGERQAIELNSELAMIYDGHQPSSTPSRLDDFPPQFPDDNIPSRSNSSSYSTGMIGNKSFGVNTFNTGMGTYSTGMVGNQSFGVTTFGN